MRRSMASTHEDGEIKVLKSLNGESRTEQVVLETSPCAGEAGVLFAAIAALGLSD